MDVITFPENRLTTSGLQILLHGVISLPDATSYDKIIFISLYDGQSKQQICYRFQLLISYMVFNPSKMAIQLLFSLISWSK